MLGRLISAGLGQTLARQFGGRAAGPAGLAIGAAVPFILRRFGPLGLAAAAAGGYAFKKYSERRRPGGGDAPIV